MNTSTISSKYQIVIPKELRKQLQLKPGQKVNLRKTKRGIEVDTTSNLDQFVGIAKGAWGEDSDAYIRGLRDEWEQHQQTIDNLHQ